MLKNQRNFQTVVGARLAGALFASGVVAQGEFRERPMIVENSRWVF